MKIRTPEGFINFASTFPIEEFGNFENINNDCTVKVADIGSDNFRPYCELVESNSAVTTDLIAWVNTVQTGYEDNFGLNVSATLLAPGLIEYAEAFMLSPVVKFDNNIIEAKHEVFISLNDLCSFLDAMWYSGNRILFYNLHVRERIWPPDLSKEELDIFNLSRVSFNWECIAALPKRLVFDFSYGIVPK